MSKYRELFFLKPLNLYVRPVSGTFMWNLDPKPSCGTLMRKSIYVKLLYGTFMTNLFAKCLCGTSGTWIILWSLSLEPWNLYLWNLGTCESGTLRNLTLYVQPEPLRVQPFYGTLGNVNLAWCGTLGNFYLEWNLGEPGARFRAAAPNHFVGRTPGFASCWGTKQEDFTSQSNPLFCPAQLLNVSLYTTCFSRCSRFWIFELYSIVPDLLAECQKAK